MEKNKFLKLLSDLREATAQGRVQWQDTADEDMFRAGIGNGMVRVGESKEFDPEEVLPPSTVYTAWLLDRKGQVADELKAYHGEEYVTLSDLYRMARRLARNADDLLSNMLAEIGKGKGTP